MRKVIAALDNTDAAEPVARFAIQLAAVLGAEVDALHVLVGGDGTARAAGQASGIELRTVEGEPAECLLREAGRDDVAAVVVGRSRRPAGAPVGAIAQQLLTGLPKPVAVVPRRAAHSGRLRSVLVPLEGTRSTTLAPRTTVELATDAGLEVVLLHVFDLASVPPFTDQPQHEAATWAKEFLARYSPCPPEDVRLETRVGRPEDHVLAVAGETGADLIALGWTQELAEGRAPVVHAALEQARLPVLLIPVTETSVEGAPAGAGAHGASLLA